MNAFVYPPKCAIPFDVDFKDPVSSLSERLPLQPSDRSGIAVQGPTHSKPSFRSLCRNEL
eukprot:COSAG06_NODE_44725_length_361_cov_0.652672_1_plen_59_part_01